MSPLCDLIPKQPFYLNLGHLPPCCLFSQRLPSSAKGPYQRPLKIFGAGALNFSTLSLDHIYATHQLC